MTSKDTNPKDAIGIRKWRQFFVVPRQVIWEVGVGMLEGALKYGRHNYRGAGVRASVYCDASLGHIEQFIEGEDVDQDSGLSHITKALCSLVVLRDAMMNDFWVDDRPPKIKDMDGLRDRLQLKVEENFERYADKRPHHYTEYEDPAPYADREWFGVNMSAAEHAAMRRMVESGEWQSRVEEAQSRIKLTESSTLQRERIAMRETTRVGAVEQQFTIYEPATGYNLSEHAGSLEPCEVQGRDLQIGKIYRAYRNASGEVIESVTPAWKIVGRRRVDGVPLAVRPGWASDHQGVPLSLSYTWFETEDWGASDEEEQNEAILAKAAMSRTDRERNYDRG